jgi:hypothetical protein
MVYLRLRQILGWASALAIGSLTELMSPRVVPARPPALSLNTLTSTQVNQIQRDLTPPRSQEFFRQGDEQVEREIRLVSRQKLQPDQILKIRKHSLPEDFK